MDIIHLAALGCFVFKDDLHGNCLGFEVRTEAAHFGCFPVRMGENQDAGDPFHPLKREGTLPSQILAPSLSPGKKFAMPCLGLGKASLRSGNFLFNFGGCPANLFVCLL